MPSEVEARTIVSARTVKRAAAALGLAAVAAILIAERRRPARPSTVPEPRRTLRNLALGVSCAVVVRLVEKPLTERAARLVEARRWGLAQRFPAPFRDPVAFLALDYLIYLWHVATHKSPALWRLHLVHHVDLDMDASTALRFHAADMLVSAPFRVAQVLVAGASPRAQRAWQSFFFLSVLFHHSRIRLGPRAERILSRLITTPGMHDIHHRATRTATDSNWSSGLSLWDHLHRSFRSDAPAAPIGVPAIRAEVTLGPSLALPFAPPDAWNPPAPPARSARHGNPPPEPAQP